MQITRVSSLTGKSTTLDLDVTEEQLSNWENGTFIQNAFPNLTPGEREFIKTGITEKEWEEFFTL